MTSLKSKVHSCKNLIHATVHQPLQVRTNKHRCFVFCVGHTSLTCVPGIGKKNKRLLNQFGIHDLSSLYSKYRSIDNIENFKEWLKNDIGFTSYQANMTTCGIGSKLGEIKEINTGLTPICCPKNDRGKRKRSIKLIDEKRKKRKGKRIKSEGSLSSSSQDQTETKEESVTLSNEEKMLYSDNSFTGVKSLDNKNDEYDGPSDQKHKSNKILGTKSTKFNSSSDINTNLVKRTQSAHPSLKASVSKTESNNVSPKTNFNLVKSENDSDQQKEDEIELTRSSTSHSSIPMKSDSSQHSMRNKMITDLKDTYQENLELPSNFVQNTKQELLSMDIVDTATSKTPVDNNLQPSLAAFQGSASKYSPNSSMTAEVPRKSILRSTQAKSASLLNADAFFSAIKQQQYQQRKQHDSFKIIRSPDVDFAETAINYGIDSGIHFKLSEVSPNQTDDQTISAIKRSYASLPISTPAVFPIKPKSKSKLETSNSDQLFLDTNTIPEAQQQVPIDSRLNATNVMSQYQTRHEDEISRSIINSDNQRETNSLISDSSKYTTDESKIAELKPSSSVLGDKSQEYISKRFISTSNESKSKEVPKEARRIVSQALKTGANIVKQDLQSIGINSISSTEVNSTEVSSIATPAFDKKPLNSTEQSLVLSPQEGTNECATKSKCVKANSSNPINQFQNGPASMNQNPFENIEFSQVRQKSDNPSSITSSSNRGYTSGDIQKEAAKVEPDLSNAVINDLLSNSSSTVHNPTYELETRQNYPSDEQLNKVSDSYKISTNNMHTSKDVAYDQAPDKENKSDKNLVKTSIIASPTNSDSTLISTLHKNNSLPKPGSLEIKQQISSINEFSESLKIKLSHESKSFSTLSSLSDSKQSIQDINSSVDKMQFNSSNINRFDKETDIITYDLSDTSAEHHNSLLDVSTTKDETESLYFSIKQDFQQKENLSTDLSVNKMPFPSDALTISSSRLTNQIINENISEISNLKEKSGSKQQTYKIDSNSKDSEQKAIPGPLFPLTCHALWDNISNEQMLSKHKNQFKQINQYDQNQNYQSSTTLLTFITRQRYLKEQQALNEHILYIEQTKSSQK